MAPSCSFSSQAGATAGIKAPVGSVGSACRPAPLLQRRSLDYRPRAPLVRVSWLVPPMPDGVHLKRRRQAACSIWLVLLFLWVARGADELGGVSDSGSPPSDLGGAAAVVDAAGDGGAAGQAPAEAAAAAGSREEGGGEEVVNDADFAPSHLFTFELPASSSSCFFTEAEYVPQIFRVAWYVSAGANDDISIMLHAPGGDRLHFSESRNEGAFKAVISDKGAYSLCFGGGSSEAAVVTFAVHTLAVPGDGGVAVSADAEAHALSSHLVSHAETLERLAALTDVISSEMTRATAAMKRHMHTQVRVWRGAPPGAWGGLATLSFCSPRSVIPRGNHRTR